MMVKGELRREEIGMADDDEREEEREREDRLVEGVKDERDGWR
jgi:hypothetical protein